MTEIQLGGHYRWAIGHVTDLQSVEIQQAHDGLVCRTLRRAGIPSNLWWIVFPDGFITIATPHELKPLGDTEPTTHNPTE